MRRALMLAGALVLAGCTTAAADPPPSPTPIPSATLERMREYGERLAAQCAPLVPVLTDAGVECWTDQQLAGVGWTVQMIREAHR